MFWLARAAQHGANAVLMQASKAGVPLGLAVGSALVTCTCAACWGLAPVVWRYSAGAEVFALNNALCAALLWIACRAVEVARRMEMELELAQAGPAAGVGAGEGAARTGERTSVGALESCEDDKNVKYND